jgi:hypothetical protein
MIHDDNDQSPDEDWSRKYRVGLLAEAVAEVSLLTADAFPVPSRRDRNQFYAERLVAADYPEDVVLLALERWPSKAKWFPSWLELVQDIETMTDARTYRTPAIIKRRAERSP